MKYARREAKEWVRDTLRDYLVTTTTPFNADLSIDEQGLRGNIDRILTFSRARGIYVNSIYQEFWTLSISERKRLTEVVVEGVNGRVPVVVGVSANCISDVLELALHAQEGGVDLVMIWPPTFGQRSPEGVLDYYRRIASQLDIGICVYASALTEIGFQLTIPMMLELAGIENVCAVKEASLNIGTYLETLQTVGDKLAVSSPLEEYWLFGRLLLGDRYAPRFLLGSSRPLYLQTPQRPLLGAFLDAVDVGDLHAANASLQEILSVTNRLHTKYLQRGDHNVALTKAITGLFGMATGPTRPPVTMPTEDEILEARTVLVDAGLLLPPISTNGAAANKAASRLVKTKGH